MDAGTRGIFSPTPHHCRSNFPLKLNIVCSQNKAGTDLTLDKPLLVDMLVAVAQICSTPSIARNISICTDVIRRSAASGAKVSFH
jgi:hypothetical protein